MLAKHKHNLRRSLDVTYCMIDNVVVISAATSGAAVVTPIKPSCRTVLYLLIVVGRTSAEGREKSQ